MLRARLICSSACVSSDLGQGSAIGRELPPALVIQLSGLRQGVPGDADEAHLFVVDDHLCLSSPLSGPDLLADPFAEGRERIDEAMELDALGPDGDELGLGEEDAEFLLWNAERSERRRLAELEAGLPALRMKPGVGSRVVFAEDERPESLAELGEGEHGLVAKRLRLDVGGGVPGSVEQNRR